ncbi:ABC transporter ATP-binding protein [Lysinibacillus agricola]|uniref:ABC transporter ATP-binding protein n=1 Tax=Lysinibacillus agricola TaxID=2590012 RepID=A0ABX7AKY7_9BACI|nr:MULTISPECIES: ABC transporter ATP-binding protein [Lysinibacillus]KOS62118.1 ABC transporter ATP-binding protein [Lysinibacillus sp. FJAT-14222]QQP10311.1 ABC transporter ATP-binding protein [Lysinibacillus agricola]
MTVISLQHVTKDYGHGRGIFDVSFNVEKGTVYGFLGPNGAGKTTAIRHIMGFSKPQQGIVTVNGLDSWTNASTIQEKLGYLPGEVALPENLSGEQFIQMMMDLRKVKDDTHCKKLIDFFELDASGKIKRMSLGMKRKLAIVTAFMHDPDVLVLDEPTSGLDPIMQQRFIDFVKEEKKRGKTILLSSHIFTEVDATCDEISIIKDGHLISSFNKQELLKMTEKVFNLTVQNAMHYTQLVQMIESNAAIHLLFKNEQTNELQVGCYPGDLPQLIKLLADFPISSFNEVPFSLEKHFMEFYDRRVGGELAWQ